MAGNDSTGGIIGTYKEELDQKVEERIQNGIPGKILELSELVKSDQFSWTQGNWNGEFVNVPVPVCSCHPDPARPQDGKGDGQQAGPSGEGAAVSMASTEGGAPPAKKIKLEESSTTSMIPVALSNKQLTDRNDLIKKHVRDLIEDANMLKMWLSFYIPKIEGGDNFGVQIQETTLYEINSVERDANECLERAGQYLSKRGNLARKIIKYPDIEDYRRSLQELDEQHFLNLRMMLTEILYNYATLHDIIVKNKSKIVKPRSEDRDLY